MEKYIASCPFVPNVECLCCDELTDYNRILICRDCLEEEGEKRTLASQVRVNAWTTCTPSGSAEFAKTCNGYIFCSECFKIINVEGCCDQHLLAK